LKLCESVGACAMADVHTFLFADLAGFTALTEAHGDEQAADLAGGFSRAAGRLLRRHGAGRIKTIGDALMLRVGRLADAVKLGLALTHDLLAECGYPQSPRGHAPRHSGRPRRRLVRSDRQPRRASFLPRPRRESVIE
jgi:adenylate cyclase